MDKLPQIVIININMGNLFSVKKACETVGLNVILSNKREDIKRASGLILPGVGAFGAAIKSLEKLDLIGPIRQAAKEGVPILGICLGMQLLFSESNEFGQNSGLDIIAGNVLRLDQDKNWSADRAKVPHVGWNHIRPFKDDARPWEGTPLSSLRPGEFMYFVHSFYVQPRDKHVILSLTEYGGVHFCSSVKQGKVFACQFHPEKSANSGLSIYRNWKKQYFDD
jgi:glutamine amidotransferase